MNFVKAICTVTLLLSSLSFSFAQDLIAATTTTIPNSLETVTSEDKVAGVDFWLFTSADNDFLSLMLNTAADQIITVELYNQKDKQVFEKDLFVIDQIGNDSMEENMLDIELPKRLRKGSYRAVMKNADNIILGETEITLEK